MTYELIVAVDVHEPIEEVEDLDPEYADVRGLALSSLELHERLAEQCGRAQARLGETERVAHEDLRAEELVEEREDDAVEDLLDLCVVAVVEREVRAEQDALKVHHRSVPDLA